MLLGDYLISKELITKIHLKIALDEQTALNGAELLGEILIRLGFTDRGVIEEALSVIAPEALVRNASTNTKVPLEYLKATRTVIIGGGTGHNLFVATLHPNPQEVFDHLAKTTGRKVIPQPASTEDILEKLATAHRSEKDTYHSAASFAADDNINRVLNTLIRDAHRAKASDIHFEPQGQTMLVRFRVDTIMTPITTLHQAQATRVISRLKDLSKMDVAHKRKPQDGSFSKEIDGRSIDFRVSTMPLATGEKIVIRILDRERNLKSLSQIGISNVDDWKDLAQSNNGLLLVCGPTGSGKTTTLYSTIHHMNRLQRSINTIEDPIEYRLAFCNQAQVNSDTGLTPANYTKAIMRQDPDVIIVGETRDSETANNCIYLATTGHLVMTTLHTTDVPSSIHRMLSLAGEGNRQLLSYVLRGIMVQRLVRTLCPVCAKAGCSRCRGTGYDGLTLLTEYARLRSPADMDAILNDNLDYYTFAMDAKEKLESGITDIEELNRVQSR